MKASRLIVLIVLLLIGGALSAQSKKENTAIIKIRKEVADINNYKLYKIRTLDNDDFLGIIDMGNELNAYFKKDSVYKIASWIGLSMWVLKTEYYFEHEKLIFVHDQQFRYAIVNNDSVDYNKPLLPIFEGRYYLNDDKLILKKEKGERYYPLEKPIKDVLLEDSKEYIKMLKTKKAE